MVAVDAAKPRWVVKRARATPVLAGCLPYGAIPRRVEEANDLWLDWIDGDMDALRQLIRTGCPPSDLAERIATALDWHLEKGCDLGATLAAAIGARRRGRLARPSRRTEVGRIRYVRAAVVAAMERGWRTGRDRDQQADLLLQRFGVPLPHQAQTLARLDYIKKTYSAHRREPIPGELRWSAVMLAGCLERGPEPARCAYELTPPRTMRPLWHEEYDEQREAWRIRKTGKPSGNGHVVELGGRRAVARVAAL